jgi:shikimate kinase
MERTGRRDTRPLLKNGDPKEILSGLMAQRYPVYAEADIRVESTLKGTAEDVARSIVAALEAHDVATPHVSFLKAPK